MASLLRQDLGSLAYYGNLTNGFSSFTLDASTDQLEWIFSTPEAATITRLGFRYTLRTGTPPTFKISLQGVDASGNPDGTIKGGGTPASATFTPPADTSWNNTWQWITLANSYAATRGEELAIVIAFDSGTIDGTNNSGFTSSSGVLGQVSGHPYTIHNNAGTRTKQAATPIYGYASSGTSYGNPLETITTLAVNTGTTPDEYALRFQLPAGAGDTKTVVGARICLTVTAGQTFTVLLYDGTTALQDVLIDTDHASATANLIYTIYFNETTLSALTFGNTYRLAVRPESASNLSGYYAEVDVNADWAAWAPGSIEWYWSQRTDAGAWSDTTNRRPLIAPLIADWTEPAGGSGMKVHPGMAGGMRG